MKSLISSLGSAFYVYVVAVLMIAFVFGAAILIFFNSSNNQGPNFVVSISPASGSAIENGIKPKFIIIFKHNPLDNYKTLTSYTNVTSDKSPTLVKTETKLAKNNSLELNFLEPTRPLVAYKLDVIKKSNNQVVFSSTYLTPDLAPTPAMSNDLKLVSFLPHKEDNYTLEYLKTENAYVFNFIYNPDSSLGIDEQVNKAKNDALQFIKSKGVDPSGIVVDWRNN